MIASILLQQVRPRIDARDYVSSRIRKHLPDNVHRRQLFLSTKKFEAIISRRGRLVGDESDICFQAALETGSLAKSVSRLAEKAPHLRG